MQYLCKAGQQVRAKAQDSAPDKDRMPLLTSTTFQEPSTDIGYKKKKRLAKSGKDITLHLHIVYIVM